jgi:Leucine-rich repeat (LRR) protein
MMLKVTLKFSFCCVIILFWACSGADKRRNQLEMEHIKDSVSEARIDSAYSIIKDQCDTLMVYQVPKMVDSLLKDPALLQNFFNTNNLYIDVDKKVEKVIRQLQADCDSNLLKETYRIALQRQKLKPKLQRKRKA